MADHFCGDMIKLLIIMVIVGFIQSANAFHFDKLFTKMKGRGRIYFCIKYRSKLIRAEPDYACFWVFTEIRSVIGWR